MIQLRVIRPRFPGADPSLDVQRKLQRDVTASSLAELFAKAEEYLQKIPETERWNVYYTGGNTNGGDRVTWHGQDVVAFDIDNILDENGNSDDEKLIDTISSTLGIDAEKCVFVKTGNGLQFLVQPLRPILTEDFFRLNKKKYDELCDAINEALQANNLRGEADKSVFTSTHIYRFPLTENRKPNKPSRQALLLRRNLEPQDFPICPEPEGVKPKKEPWQAGEKDQVTEAQLRYFKVDSPSVEEGCEFLKYAKADQNSLTEAQWYGMLSVVTRLENGREKAHEYSKDDPRYSYQATEKKIDQALSASGPRTCANINGLWEGCPSCPNYKKVNSPISLKSNDFISTEFSGFHLLTEKGGLRPQVPDLRKYFERLHPYRVDARSGVVFVYDEQKYRTWSIHELRAFAQKHFDPEVPTFVVNEFTQSVARVNLIDTNWFTDSIRDKINFSNGVFDLKTGELLEHNPRWGFLYKLPFDYDADATCPTFDSFIDAVSCGDKQLAQILLEFIGYAICDRDYWMQKGLILIGSGSNGKSSFFEIIEALIGTQNTSFLNFEALKSGTSRSHLEGKVINLGDELPYYTLKSTDFFKNLFGGTVETKKLYHDSTFLRNTTKFIFAGNEMPSSEDLTNGFFRRLVLVPFDANFKIGGNADPKIVQKMKLELPGIFNRVMKAYKGMEARGDFTHSDAVQRTLDEYKQDIDMVGTWVEENLTVKSDWSDNEFETIPVIYERFVSHCIRNNVKPINGMQFSKRLSRSIPRWKDRYTRKRISGEYPRVVQGVRIGASELGGDKAHF